MLVAPVFRGAVIASPFIYVTGNRNASRLIMTDCRTLSPGDSLLACDHKKQPGRRSLRLVRRRCWRHPEPGAIARRPR
jgi:hypothetical protein